MQSILTDSKWFKSYGISKMKIMAETLKMRVPHPNDTNREKNKVIYGILKDFSNNNIMVAPGPPVHHHKQDSHAKVMEPPLHAASQLKQLLLSAPSSLSPTPATRVWTTLWHCLLRTLMAGGPFWEKTGWK